MYRSKYVERSTTEHFNLPSISEKRSGGIKRASCWSAAIAALAPIASPHVHGSTMVCVFVFSTNKNNRGNEKILSERIR